MYSDTIFLLKIKGGQVVGLVGKVLTLQVQGKAFKPQNPHNKSQVLCCVFVIPVLEGHKRILGVYWPAKLAYLMRDSVSKQNMNSV